MKIQLVIDTVSDVCTVMLEDDDHDHTKTTRNSGGCGISSNVKELINEYESHIIALALRLNLASYTTVAYSTPLTSKRKAGRPAKTGHCLQRQASELQPEPELYALTDEEDDN